MTSNTATATAAPSTFSCAIRSQDFRPYLDDKHRNYWTSALLNFVIEALDGAPVAVTVDRLTGHTEVGVRLVETRRSSYDGSARLRVERVLSDGTVDVTDFRVDAIGDTIIPLAEPAVKGAKWRALDLARKGGHTGLEHRR